MISRISRRRSFSRFDENELQETVPFLARSGTPSHLFPYMPRWDLSELFPEGAKAMTLWEFRTAAFNFLNAKERRVQELDGRIERIVEEGDPSPLVSVLVQLREIENDIRRCEAAVTLMQGANPKRQDSSLILDDFPKAENAISRRAMKVNARISAAVLPLVHLDDETKRRWLSRPELTTFNEYFEREAPPPAQKTQHIESEIERHERQREARESYYAAHEQRKAKTKEPEKAEALFVDGLQASVANARRVAHEQGFSSALDKFCHDSDVPPALVQRLMNEAATGYGDMRAFEGGQINGEVRYQYACRAYNWDYAGELITEAFERFDPKLGAFARHALDHNWVHAVPIRNKLQAAHGTGIPELHPGAHTYGSVSFNGTLRSVIVLAHELGHMAAFHFAAENQTTLNHPSIMLNECYAKLAVRIVGEHLFLREASMERQLAAKLGLIYDMSDLYYQTANAVFYHALMKASESGVVLNSRKVNELYIATNYKLYSPNDSDGLTTGWTHQPHYFIQAPYYHLTYALSEVMAGAFWDQWKQAPLDQRPAMAREWVDLMAQGGNIGAAEAFAKLGIDLNDPGLVQQSLRRTQAAMQDFNELTEQFEASPLFYRSQHTGWRARILESLIRVNPTTYIDI